MKRKATGVPRPSPRAGQTRKQRQSAQNPRTLRAWTTSKIVAGFFEHATDARKCAVLELMRDHETCEPPEVARLVRTWLARGLIKRKRRKGSARHHSFEAELVRGVAIVDALTSPGQPSFGSTCVRLRDSWGNTWRSYKSRAIAGEKAPTGRANPHLCLVREHKMISKFSRWCDGSWVLRFNIGILSARYFIDGASRITDIELDLSTMSLIKVLQNHAVLPLPAALQTIVANFADVLGDYSSGFVPRN